ncbi:hypothetical protein BH09ACT12_BH09ACT12_37390 [soil metagenome]
MLRHAPVTRERITPADLSERERQVIERICRGDANSEIAAELYLSINTVKTHIRSAYRRIGVTRRVDAIRWGAQQGLVAAPEAEYDA